MLKNYFKTAFRNLLRYKGFAMINISSLTIGIIGCFVIGLFVWDEWQFDKNIPGGENVYRIYEQRNDNGNITYGSHSTGLCQFPGTATIPKLIPPSHIHVG